MTEFKRHEPGTFCYVELASTDPAASGKFYTGLFGWGRNDQDLGEFGIYTQFLQQGKIVAAQYKMTPEQVAMEVPPSWVSFVSVADADAATEKVPSLGGKVVLGPTDVMDYGRMSILADPAGAVFCLWEAREKGGVELREDPGALCWNELMVPDPEEVKAFYAGLFGWGFEAMDLGEMGRYTLFKNAGGRDVGGMMAMSPEMGPIPAHWMVYFSSADVDATMERALSLGGKSLVGPRDIPEVGRFGVIADPVGAVFAVYRSLWK